MRPAHPARTLAGESDCPHAAPVTGPVKRSIMIAGHATSISLEPVFWDALKAAAAAEGAPLSALVARIDAARIEAAEPANLASAIRVWLFGRLKAARPD